MKKTTNYFFNLSPDQRRITPATVVTFMRIFLTPCIVIAIVNEYWLSAFILFFITALTDGVDGALARWRNERTRLGAILDPVADKLLLSSVFYTFGFIQSPSLPIPPWFVIIILVKELILVIGAVIVYWCTGQSDIYPTLLGKATTIVQMFFIAWLFGCYFFMWVPLKIYYCFLSLVLSAVVLSGIQYVYQGYRQIVKQRLKV